MKLKTKNRKPKRHASSRRYEKARRTSIDPSSSLSIPFLCCLRAGRGQTRGPRVLAVRGFRASRDGEVLMSNCRKCNPRVRLTEEQRMEAEKREHESLR